MSWGRRAQRSSPRDLGLLPDLCTLVCCGDRGTSLAGLWERLGIVKCQQYPDRQPEPGSLEVDVGLQEPCHSGVGTPPRSLLIG